MNSILCACAPVYNIIHHSSQASTYCPRLVMHQLKRINEWNFFTTLKCRSSAQSLPRRVGVILTQSLRMHWSSQSRLTFTPVNLENSWLTCTFVLWSSWRHFWRRVSAKNLYQPWPSPTQGVWCRYAWKTSWFEEWFCIRPISRWLCLWGAFPATLCYHLKRLLKLENIQETAAAVQRRLKTVASQPHLSPVLTGVWASLEPHFKEVWVRGFKLVECWVTYGHPFP